MRGLTATRAGRHCLPGFIVAGAGVGLVNPALASTAIGVVPPQRSGMASGINSTFRQVGIATGHRRARGDLRERDREQARARGSPGRPRPATAHAICARRRGAAAPARSLAAVPAGAARPGHGGDPQRVRRRDERHPARRRDRRPRRGGAGARARPRPGTSSPTELPNASRNRHRGGIAECRGPR